MYEVFCLNKKFKQKDGSHVSWSKHALLLSKNDCILTLGSTM